MKKTIICAALTAALMSAHPAFAQDAAPPAVPAAPVEPVAPATAPDAAKPPAPRLIDPDLLKVYIDMMKDIKRLGGHHTPLKERVDLARNFTFSPDTRAELKNQFGNDDPFQVTVEDLPEGGAAIHGKSDPLDHADVKNGSTLHIDPVTFDSVVNRNYTGARFNAAIADVKMTSPGDLNLVDISDIGFHGETTVGPFNFMIGKTTARAGHVHFGAGEKFGLDINDIAVDVDASARKKMFDERIVYRIASIDWGSDKVENIVTDVALLNIDGQSMENLTDFMESTDIYKNDDAAQSEAFKTMFKRFALDLSRHNGVIEIRDISAQYHGGRAGLSGRVTLPDLKESDLDSMQKTYEKLAVRLRVHVPMATIDEIAHRASRAMMESQARQSGAQVTDMAVDLVARGLVGKMTDTLVKQQKWAHMDKGELVTVLEIKKGNMYLDKHLVNAKSNPFMAMAQGK